MHFSRLYNRLFNSTKEKPEESNVSKEDDEEAAAAQREQLRSPYPWNGIYDPISGRQLISSEVLNVRIPNQANGQQFYGSIGGFGYGGFGTGIGQGYGFTFPGYPQIYGSSDYNNVPTVQVFEQPGFGIGSPSNYYNLIATNDGKGQPNDVLAPYRELLLQQQLFSPRPALSYDDGLDYGEELVDVEVENDFGYDKDDDEDEYELDEYDDYGDEDEGEDELWRQANGGLKVKRKKNQNKSKSKSKSQAKQGKKKRKQQRVTKWIIY